jgi:hypothetical protein
LKEENKIHSEFSLHLMEKQITQQQNLVAKKRKSRFDTLEDSNLKTLVEKHGTKDWVLISSLMINRYQDNVKKDGGNISRQEWIIVFGQQRKIIY